jgi:tetratricopeptide (TPR) repeat protein
MIGTVISHYRVEAKIGEGGMGIVYRATDVRLGRAVALKFLTRRVVASAEQRARFEREALVISRLNHPHIATLYDYDEADGLPFLVMEYLPGGTLGDKLRALEPSAQTLPLETILQYGRQIGGALAYAHEHGVVHRDLKPDNIILSERGELKVTDFGLAKIEGASKLSSGSVRVGTPAYMSPEQVVGDDIDGRSDIYSFGTILYETATGRLPFDSGYEMSLLYDIVNTPAPPVGRDDLPEEFARLIAKTLEKQPSCRYQSMDEVVAALSALQGRQTVVVRTPRGSLTETQPLAESLRPTAQVFVGRREELARLQGILGDALGHEGRVALLQGEPGSGKTTTAEQICVHARLSGATVLIGRCEEAEGAPVFWPWLQLIQSYIEVSTTEQLEETFGPCGAHLASLVPQIREKLPDLPASETLEPRQARFRLFECISNSFRRAALRAPLVLFFDDLQWADEPSLRLLEFMSSSLKETRILILGTCRDLVLGRDHPLTRTLAELVHQGHSDRIVLGGLSEKDVARFMQLSLGAPQSPTLIQAVHRRTEGNPFFLTEIVKLLAAEGHDSRSAEESLGIKIPLSIREVIRQRLTAASKECVRVLEVASVAGRRFTTEVLEKPSGLDYDRVVEVLDEAEANRLVMEADKATATYAFSHALVQETIYQDLGPGNRRRLHQQVGEALEQLYAENLELHLNDLAYHFQRAARRGHAEKAVRYAVAAAEKAAQLLAHEESSHFYERALESLPLLNESGELRRCELYALVGEQYKRAGKVANAREAFQNAADIARKLNAPEHFANAALGLRATLSEATGTVDELQVRLLEEALKLLPAGDSVLRAKVTAQLSAASYYAPERRASLSLKAVEMSLRLKDPEALASALYCRHVALVVTVDLRERLGVSTQLLQMAQRSGNQELILRARYRRILDFMELGDIASVDVEIDAYTQLAADLRQPRYLWSAKFFQSARRLLAGRLVESEQLAQEAMELGRRVQDQTAPVFVMAMQNLLRALQGRPAEQIDPLNVATRELPMIPGNRAILAYQYALMRKADEARKHFDAVSQNNFTDFPKDGSYIVVLCTLGFVSWFLRDAPRAKIIYELLEPYGGRNIMIGNTGVGCGSIHRPFGYCFAAMSDWDEAIRQFSIAIDMNVKMGAKVFEAGARCELATVLLARGRPEDRATALAHLDEATEAATAMEVASVLMECREARQRFGIEARETGPRATGKARSAGSIDHD